MWVCGLHGKWFQWRLNERKRRANEWMNAWIYDVIRIEWIPLEIQLELELERAHSCVHTTCMRSYCKHTTIHTYDTQWDSRYLLNHLNWEVVCIYICICVYVFVWSNVVLFIIIVWWYFCFCCRSMAAPSNSVYFTMLHRIESNQIDLYSV